MLKHSHSSASERNGILKADPGDMRKGHEFFESAGSISSSSSSSSDSSLASRLSEGTYSHTARNVWDRYTSSSSELRNGNGSLLVNADSFTKPRSLPTNSKLISTPGSKTSAPSAPVLETSGGGGDASRIDKDKEENVDGSENKRIVETPNFVTNSPIEADDGLMKKLGNKVKMIEKRGRRLFGFSRLETAIVVTLLFLCLVMYVVLLMLTLKASKCSDAVVTYFEQRKESFDELLKSTILDVDEEIHLGN